tara:strand:+ start:13062 stop:13475 length:414 start_codon:yes stop_codon:yes gene_type:complete
LLHKKESNLGYTFSEKSLSRLEGVDTGLVEVMKEALSLSKIDFGIPPYGGVRSLAEQQKLYATGKSKADGILRESRHQKGKAVDVYAYVDGKASWEPEHLTHIATAVLQSANKLHLPVKWGGLWKNFVDMPHFERVK